MHLEFLSDRKTFFLALIALSALAMLAAGFVYPRHVARRLSALRVLVLILFFIGVVALTLVYPVQDARVPALFILQDRSVSMNQPLSKEGPTRMKLAEEIQGRLLEACESAGIQPIPIFFSEEASDQPSSVGDLRTTRFSPALSLLLEKIASGQGMAAARAVLISDGAAADEPMIDPYLSALVSRGIQVDVWSLGSAQEGDLPKLFFKFPPPPTATAGESIPLDVGLVSRGSTRVTVSDAGSILTDQAYEANTEELTILFTPKLPGIRKVTVTAQNAAGSSKIHFRVKVLPRLLFELSGRPSWDARYFLVSAGGRPGVSVRGRWTNPEAADPNSARIRVSFGPPERLQVGRGPRLESVQSADPVLYWPQSEMSGSGHGIRWLGREVGAFSTAAEPGGSIFPGSMGRSRLQPISARQKISLDLGWQVIERYRDGGVFLAERADTLAAPAFLVNAEGLWRWWVNPILSAPKPQAAAAVEYERFLDRIMSWARRMTFPAAELFALQEAGQIGAPLDLIALFSTPPAAVPPVRIFSPDGSSEEIYGAGTTSVRYSFTPRLAGSYRVELAGVSKRPVETAFEVSDAPFDVAHPEPRPDLLRRIAARTGGRVLSGAENRALDQTVARDLLAHFETVQAASSRIEERRIRLAHSPLFFIVLTSLFALLWTLESRWIR